MTLGQGFVFPNYSFHKNFNEIGLVDLKKRNTAFTTATS